MKILLLMCACFVLSGCLKEVDDLLNQTTSTTAFEVSYDHDERSLRGIARFGLGAKLIEIPGKGFVLLNLEKLSRLQNALGQPYYQIKKMNVEMTTVTGGHYVFYQDDEGHQYSNRVHIPGSVQMNLNATVLTVNAQLVAQWSSNDSIGSHSLALTIADATKEHTQVAEGNLQVSSGGTITIPSAVLRNLGPGAYKVQLCRSGLHSNSNLPAGGSIETTYCTAKQLVHLTF